MKLWFVRLMVLLAAFAFIGCGADSTEDSNGGGDTGGTSSGDAMTSSNGMDASSGGDGMVSSSGTSSSGMTSSSGTSSSGMTSSSGGGMCMAGQTQCAGSSLQTCNDGEFITTMNCDNGCQNGACVTGGPIVPGTCSQPTPLTTDGTPVSGTTDTTYNPNNWSQQCKEKYNGETGEGFFDSNGPESAFRINVSTPQYLTITVEPDPATPAYMAFYVRGECNALNTNVWRACKGNSPVGAPFSQTQLFAAGQHDILVDSFGTGDADVGDFTIKVEPDFIPPCGGAITQLPQILDPSGGPISVSDSTANGDSQAVISNSTQYCGVDPISSGRTPGNERIFAFALRERQNVRIEVSPTSGTNEAFALGVYIRPDVCGEMNVVDVQEREMNGACAASEWDGAAWTTAVIDKSLPPGAYYIFVDEGRQGETHDFDLTLTVTD